MGELVAPFPGLAGLGQDPVHGPLGSKIDALVEQGGDHLGRGDIDEPGCVQQLTDGLAFGVRQRPRRAGARRPRG
jgi:hypothetical protein